MENSILYWDFDPSVSNFAIRFQTYRMNKMLMDKESRKTMEYPIIIFITSDFDDSSPEISTFESRVITINFPNPTEVDFSSSITLLFNDIAMPSKNCKYPENSHHNFRAEESGKKNPTMEVPSKSLRLEEQS
jgi:hypothetical protein